MCWTDRVKHGVGLATVAALALGVGETADAATMVVRSDGPSAGSYPPGKTLDPAGSITLRAGDTITVLDAGGTHVLKGPGAVRVTGSGTASATGVAALLANTGVRQSRTGATRGASSGAPRPANVWYVDASRDGPVCIANPVSVTVWRPDYTAAETLTLTRASDGKTAPVTFAVGQPTRAWPLADLPLTDGARFRVTGPGAATKLITIRLLGSAPTALDSTAQTLLANHCAAQLDLLMQATMVVNTVG